MGSDPVLSPGVRYHFEHRREEMSFQSQARETLPRLPSGAKRILDLGCGTAALAPDLIDSGRTYTGADRDGSMLAWARQRLKGLSSALVRADATRLPFATGSFDAVTSLGLFEYLPEPAEVLREVRRVLKPGGVIVLTVPRRDSLYRRCQALVAPLLRLAGRKDPFDLRSGRMISPADIEVWAAEAGLRLAEAIPVSPMVLPWPLDRALPGVARSLASRASRRWGTVHLVALVPVSPAAAGETPARPAG
jgi:SAM-dependent methyltransferase